MKAPAFAYARPTSLRDTYALLDEHRDNAKILAGGQSLMPVLNMRLASHGRATDPLTFQWTISAGFLPEPVVTRQYAQRDYPFIFTNGFQASYVEVDVESGFVKLLKHWCVEDCGTLINPQLVDEQLRGGIVQGIGAALFEHCLYAADAQMLNGNMADYLVALAAEMPEIVIAPIETPTETCTLGAKGAGEAGTAGAPAAVMNAINDALLPFNARVTTQPATPECILRALGQV